MTMEITAWDLLEHYFAYLTSPAILTVLSISSSVLLFGYLQGTLVISSGSDAISGCFRVGLRGRSILDSIRTPDGSTKIEALFTYPLRGCRGIGLEASQVDWYGLRYDDLFTFAHLVSTSKDGQHDSSQRWQALTIAECPLLDKLSVELWPSKSSHRRSFHNGSARPAPDALKAGAASSHRPNGGHFYENGGCLIIKFPHCPTFNLLGLITTEKVIYIPLEAISERSILNNHKTADYIDGGESKTGIHLTAEVDGKTLLALQKFLGFGPLSLFKTRSASGGVNAGTSGTISVAHRPTGQRANIYLTGSPIKLDIGSTVIMGRRIARTKPGYIELDGDYSVESHDGKNVSGLNTLFEQGLLRIGDEVKLQQKSLKLPIRT